MKPIGAARAGMLARQVDAIPDSVKDQFVASEYDETSGDWTSEEGTVLSSIGAPTLLSNELNGEPVIRYDGVDDGHENTSYTLSQPLAIVAVWKLNETGASGIRSVQSGLDTDLRPLPDFDGFIQMYAGGNLVGGNTSADTNWHIHATDFDGANSENRIDGTSDATGDAGTDGFDGMEVAFNSQQDAIAVYTNIDIAEFWILDNPSAQDVENAEQYLNDKYAVY